MTTAKPITATQSRKLSWIYDDLSKKIQVAPRHLAAKLVLRHLGSSADDRGQSHHGYASIAAHCSISRSQTALALKYLRDTLKVVTWAKGSGGSTKLDTNEYTLDMSAMTNLVAEQGVFNPETGKLIRVESDDQTRVESDDETGLIIKSSPMKAPTFGRSSPMKPSVESDEALSRVRTTDCNPHITLRGEEPSVKINPQLSKDDGSVFSDLTQVTDKAPDVRKEVPAVQHTQVPENASMEIWDDGIFVGWKLTDGSEVLA